MSIRVSQKVVTELAYAEIVVGIVVSLILVSFWQRALENWLFESLGINRKSTYQTFIIAIVATIIFFVFINIVESLARDTILGLGDGGVAETRTGMLFSSKRKVSSKVVQNEEMGCEDCVERTRRGRGRG